MTAKKFDPKDIVCITGEETTAHLQEASERNAIWMRIKKEGGRCRIGTLNEAFGFDTRVHIDALRKTRWVKVIPHTDYSGKLPRKRKTLGKAI